MLSQWLIGQACALVHLRVSRISGGFPALTACGSTAGIIATAWYWRLHPASYLPTCCWGVNRSSTLRLMHRRDVSDDVDAPVGVAGRQLQECLSVKSQRLTGPCSRWLWLQYHVCCWLNARSRGKCTPQWAHRTIGWASGSTGFLVALRLALYLRQNQTPAAISAAQNSKRSMVIRYSIKDASV